MNPRAIRPLIKINQWTERARVIRPSRNMYFLGGLT